MSGGRLVVGLGNTGRGDDAVGAEVVDRVPPECATRLVLADPGGLIDAFAGYDPVVVVDAMRSGAPAGTIAVLRTGALGSPLPAGPPGRPASTHGLGLRDVIEMARVLGRLPQTLTVVAVEAAGFENDAGLSHHVRTAVPRAVDEVVRALGG